jgi:hypothetical protein
MMGDFFYGWRRKAGCITLMMASVVTAAWIRSLTNDDMFEPLDRKYLISGDGSLVWAAQADDVRMSFVDSWYDSLMGRPEIDDPGLHVNIPWTCVKRIGSIGIDYGRHEFDIHAFNWLRMQYWTITSPLTLLSAYLILWPGKQPPKSPPN